VAEMVRAQRPWRKLSSWVFVTGVVVACCFAARPIYPDGAGAARPSARLVAWLEAAGLPFGVGVALMVCGALLGRARRPPRRRGSEASAPTAGPEQVLLAVQRKLTRLEACDPVRQAASMLQELDDILSGDVPRLLRLRSDLVGAVGPLRYAVLVGFFASTERYVARAWSALADRAPAEVGPSLRQAQFGVEQAISELAAAQGERGPTDTAES
jgi:hypothetical protein